MPLARPLCPLAGGSSSSWAWQAQGVWSWAGHALIWASWGFLLYTCPDRCLVFNLLLLSICTGPLTSVPLLAS